MFCTALLIFILLLIIGFFQVPRSTKKLYEDNEYALYTVTLFNRVADNFRTSAREKGFQVSLFQTLHLLFHVVQRTNCLVSIYDLICYVDILTEIILVWNILMFYKTYWSMLTEFILLKLNLVSLSTYDLIYDVNILKEMTLL